MALTQITEKGIKDGEILNADINASAAIAGSKIDPTFTSTVNVTNNLPEIFLTDANTSNARGRINANAGGLLLGADNDNAAADSVISFAVDGSEKARINSSGNVGIGTTSPAVKLDVTGKIHASTSIGIRTTSPQQNLHVHQTDSGASVVKFTNSTTTIGSSNGFDIGLDSSEQGFLHVRENKPLLFEINGSERMRIDESGNVSIGTTTTISNQRLKVNGNVVIDNGTLRCSDGFSSDTDLILNADANNDSGNSIIFKESGTEKMRLDSSGNLVVGGTSAQASDSATLMADGEVTAAGFYFTNNIGSPMNSDGIRRATTNTMVFDTNSTERMRIDSSGNVGIGTTSLSDKFTIGDGDLKFFNSDEANNHRTTFIEFTNSSNRITSEANFGSESSSNYSAGYKFTTKNFNGSAFETVNAMAIQAQGHILIGQTSPDVAATGARFASTSVNQAASYMYRGDAGIVMIFGGGGGSGQGLIDFRHGGTSIGSVTKNGTSNVSFNTSSDYRLKENIVDLTGAIARIKTLQPKRFNWISDETNTLQDGFLAHEVTAVPEAVTGEKDAVVTQELLDSKKVEEVSIGDPIYQQLDHSKLVPLLTAALQEEIAKRETLETRVAALEAA
jgi:hypothetical protein